MIDSLLLVLLGLAIVAVPAMAGHMIGYSKGLIGKRERDDDLIRQTKLDYLYELEDQKIINAKIYLKLNNELMKGDTK